MTVFGLELELTSPALLAAAPPASNLIETLGFIPGNTLRGVLAWRYMDAGGDPAGEEFRRLFLAGEMRCGFGFREGSEVVPLSARSCKYDPGFPTAGHGVVDTLFDSEAGVCPACTRALDSFAGYWLPGEARQVKVDTRLITRTAIDPMRGTARSGQLFSQRVLAENQCFVASLEVADDLAPAVETLLKEPFQGRIGTGSSRGQGWVEVRQTSEAGVVRSSARERFEAFRSALGRPVLTVTLLTDGLFRDDYLRDAPAPSLTDLIPLGIQPEEWEPCSDAFMDLRRIFGFDGEPLRLPRPARMAAVAGSVFLFEARNGADPTPPPSSGEGWIGEGNGEGYGRAVLWHPFHLDFRRSRP
jgi:hypothetical protein